MDFDNKARQQNGRTLARREKVVFGRFRRGCSALVVMAIGVAFAPGQTRANERDKGSITGIVSADEPRVPVAFANVVLLGTSLGAMTDGEGRYVIANVPPGTYRMKAVMMGHVSLEVTQVTVTAGEVTSRDFWLEVGTLTQVAASAESVGVDTRIDSRDITCEIIPLLSEFRVGERAYFDVLLRNGSDETFYLVRSLDGSTRSSRYPHAELSIEGPSDGIEMSRIGYCGTLNSIGVSDFKPVGPRDTFDPFAEGGFRPDYEQYAIFAKPGDYTVTFRYSTDERDIRKWLGTWGRSPLPEELSLLIRLVPRINVGCSIIVRVIE